jgi:hypothetical protein
VILTVSAHRKSNLQEKTEKDVETPLSSQQQQDAVIHFVFKETKGGSKPTSPMGHSHRLTF